MSDEFRITSEQMDVLKSLECERLQDHPAENVALLKTFTVKNKKWRGPLQHLQNDGLTDDTTDRAAVYIVKTNNGQGLFAFSLKCCELYNLANNDFRLVHAILSTLNANRNFQSLPIEKKTAKLDKIFHDIGKSNKLKSYIRWASDCQLEQNNRIKRVKNTIPGLLLVDFCKNYSAQQIWIDMKLGADRTMGQVIFWFFVYPILEKVRSLVGCEYILLYAADVTKDGNLINFYKDLHFHRETGFGVNKPEYDLICPLMSQRISEMKAHRDELEATFNKSPVKPTAEESAKLDSSLG